jgi:phospholipase C
VKRRDFLRGAAAGAVATMLPGGASLVFGRGRPRLKGGSILDRPPAQAPIDTIVVVMMENRSFDHYLGWLATDEAYLEAGRSAYGRKFTVDGSQTQQFLMPDGTPVDTHRIVTGAETNPFRGCPFGDPGHSWTEGRAQRDGGFLATGSDNDELALGYYTADDLPYYAALARRFTVFDRYHSSCLGPTYPNREYMHSAQSGGIKSNAFPFEVGYPDGFDWPTIWEKLAAATVPGRYYYSDLPATALFGPRLNSISSPIANYFQDAAAGQLPNVVFVDPKFLGDGQTDEHPLGDVRAGQRFTYEVVKAFVDSPQWERGVMFLTYDEWGGFFDHVAPPVVRDDRASDVDADNFGQLGFRVPTRMISPYARPGFVDHQLYDHSSILRFIEWRFLGAPAHGAGRKRRKWWLTTRDRYANNIGFSLKPRRPELEVDLPEATTETSPACAEALTARSAAGPMTDFARAYHQGFFERMGYKVVGD